MAYLDTFRGRVGAALAAVQRVLETNRHPVFPADVPHTYQDKYALADLMASTAIAAQLNVLESLGLSHENLLKLVAWSQGRSVTLRYQSEERCNFLREETRKEESASQHVSTTKILGVTATSTSKVITKITEYFWAYAYQYVIYAYRGNDLEERIFIAGNEGSAELKTTSNTPPHPEATVFPPQEVDITFLLNHVASDSVVVTFKINRESPKCHTPSQNPDIRKLSSGFSNLSTWFNNVSSRFTSSFLSVERSLGLAHSNFLNTTSIFSPVVPLFEASSGSKSEGAKVIVASSLIPNQDVASDSSVMSAADMNRFLTEQRRTIAEAYSNLETVFPHRRLLTAGDVRLPVIASHASAVIQDFFLADQLIESMLHSQLVAAVGKELQAHHFSEYMTFHNRKLFREEFQPRAFCYAIRRPEHYPEGLISVEREDRGSSEPIVTSVRSVEPVHPMQFSLDASTQVTFTGHRYLHAWIDHSFASSSTSGLSLVARARQFSSFIIMVGRIASAFLFEPVAALIIQNKDDLKVPLILEQIPSAKEFRDSIESLSPEQQDFAKAFRAMQLESTLFGVCVIQIKPQLEKLLRLPADSLTKEIELSQDLLELFIKYQIPSDLLSYDGDEDNTPGEKIKVVQQYVQAMKDMIEAKKAAEIKATAQASINQYFDDEPSYRERSKKKSVRKRSLRRDRSDGGMAECLSLEASAECSDPFDSAPEPPSESPSEPDAEKTPSTETAITEADVFDFTKIPGELDARFGKLDIEGALRPTIIKPAPSGWTKKYQESLLSSPATTTLNETELSTEKNKAFDLLDALSRSGSLTVDEADLHVLIASTHCFEKTLMHTLIQDNVNPIEKVERSLLIVAETVQSRPATELLKPDQLERVQEFSPNLFE